MKQYTYQINGNAYDVTIQSISGRKAQVEVNGIPFEVEMRGSQLTEDMLPEMAVVAGTAEAQEPAAPASTEPAPAAGPATGGGSGEGEPVKAPLPGVVTKVCVSVGQKVKKGETVLVLEAMKMENNIAAEQEGEVTGIAVKAGDSVLEGTVMLTIR